MNFNTSKQRKEIWFHLHEPNNLYDLWLHQNDKQKYILQIYDKSEWHTIGGDGDECKCPVWIQSITNKPSWWTSAENYDWHKPKQVSLSIGNNNISLYGPIEESISIEIPSVETTNMLNWVGSEDGFLLGTLQSSVNGVQASIELKIDLDDEITDEDTDLSIPSSQAVYELINNVLTDLQELIDEKQDKIPTGTNGQILSWNNGFQWINPSWFRYKAVSGTNIVFSRNSTSSGEKIEDAFVYDISNNVQSVTIQNVYNPDEYFKAGTMIKCKAGSNATLTIGDAYSVVMYSALTHNNDVYEMVDGTTYYIYIKMNSVVIYSTSVEAHYEEEYVDFEFIYFMQENKTLDSDWENNIRSVLMTNPSTGDSDSNTGVYFMDLVNKTQDNIVWLTDSLQQTNNPGFIFIAMRQGLGYDVVIKSNGLVSKLNPSDKKGEFVYDYNGETRTYDLYRYGYQNNSVQVCVIKNNSN